MHIATKFLLKINFNIRSFNLTYAVLIAGIRKKWIEPQIAHQRNITHFRKLYTIWGKVAKTTFFRVIDILTLIHIH